MILNFIFSTPATLVLHVEHMILFEFKMKNAAH